MLDTFHRVIPLIGTIPYANSIRILIEDGGEMLSISLIVVYDYNLKITSKELAILLENV